MIKFSSSGFLLKLFGRSSSNSTGQGWTLIEVGVVVIIVSILASLAFPSFGKMQARNQLRGAMSQVQVAFQEAQRNAIKKGSSCEITINASNGTIAQDTDSANSGCIPNPVVIPNDQGITMASTSTTITFSYKGNPSSTNLDAGNNELITLSHDITSLEDRCLVIASGIGIMRSGYYDGTDCTPAP